jgi:hypothetical protein
MFVIHKGITQVDGECRRRESAARGDWSTRIDAKNANDTTGPVVFVPDRGASRSGVRHRTPSEKGVGRNLISGGSFTASDVARAASDVKPGAIVRFPVEWAGIQPTCATLLGSRASSDATCATPGPYSWTSLDSKLDSIATYLTSGQVRILPVPLNAPQWAWGPLDHSLTSATCPGWIGHAIMPPGDDAKGLGYWQQFVAALVRHVEGRYGASTLFGAEVWNEEDGCGDWSTSLGVNAARYTSVLASASRGVRTVDGSLPVIFGGTGRDGRYLTAAYDAAVFGRPDIRAYMTSIGVHPYADQNLGQTWSNSPSDPTGGFQLTMNDAAQVAAEHHDGGRPLSITEFGYPILSPAPTELEQAQWDLLAYQLASGGTWSVNVMLVHSLFDGPFGVCVGPLQPRLAATTFKQFFSGNQTAQATC